MEEKTLSSKNVGTLGLLWKIKVPNHFYSLAALTAPVVATNVSTPAGVRSVVYVAGISGTVFALDAQTGEEVWTNTFRSMVLPRKGGFQGTFLCPNGITATPVIDNEAKMLFAIAPDGSLYGLDLGTGSVGYGPVQFVAPFSKNWSLNLFEGTIYTTISLGCGNGRAGIYSVDVQSPLQPAVRQTLLSKGYRGGIWGRGGPVIGKNGKVYGGTADGDPDPQMGDYSNTVVSASAKGAPLIDYFMPPNWTYLKRRDLDVGSASPVWFSWNNRNLLAHGFKEGVVYLMDADNLGGTDHHTALYTSPRLGNDKAECCAADGIWGGLSTSQDDDGQTWLYVPMGGPPASNGPKFPISNGDNPHGSIMAFRVIADPKTHGPMLAPGWVSGDFDYPDPAVIANGVLFALSNGENPDQRGDESKRFLNTRTAVLKALDAKTGKELWDSGDSISSWVHFSGIAVADGRIYAVDHDSNVYCFGLMSARPSISASPTRKASLTGGGNTLDELSTSWVGRAARQDEVLRNWAKRAGITLTVAFMAALAGVFFGIRRAHIR